MTSPTTRDGTLAADGGQKIRTKAWPKRFLFGTDEKNAVMALFDEAIRTGHDVLGYNGPQETAYCREFAEFLGGGFADGVNSGTSAVYVALRALELPAYSEVIVPPITDPGGVMPVPLINCIPVVADSTPGSYNTGAAQIQARLTDRTRAIIVAHIAGIPLDLEPILELAAARGLPVIEDCAQAHGARYKGRLVGTMGTIAAFSTMFGKHHATGGQGGVVFTPNEELYWRIRRYADRGKPFGMESASGNFTASLNFNMDEIHAAIGRLQLRKLPEMVQRRRQLAAGINEQCESRVRAVQLVGDPPWGESVYWFLFFRIDPDRLTVPKDTFVRALQAEGIPADPSYLHVPSMAPWWRDRAVFGTPGLPWSNPLYRGDADCEQPVPNILETDRHHLRVMFHEDWTEQEVDDLVAAMEKVEAAYAR